MRAKARKWPASPAAWKNFSKLSILLGLVRRVVEREFTPVQKSSAKHRRGLQFQDKEKSCDS
jgi:hypothetical protein